MEAEAELVNDTLGGDEADKIEDEELENDENEVEVVKGVGLGEEV